MQDWHLSVLLYISKLNQEHLCIGKARCFLYLCVVKRRMYSKKMNETTAMTSNPPIIKHAADFYEIRLSMISGSKANIYLIRQPNRDLLIDTGGVGEDAHAELHGALDKLAVDRSHLDVLLTHLHEDHFGGLEVIWQPGMRVFSNIASMEEERAGVAEQFDVFLPSFNAFEGLRERPAVPAEDFVLAYKRVNFDPPVTYVGNNDVLSWGRYTFEIIETPGHQRNEICLWEPSQRFMMVGDMVMTSAYANLFPSNLDYDEVQELFDSLDFLKSYAPSLVYSGHGEVILASDFGNLCDKAISHHKRRMHDASVAAKQGYHSLAEIAYHYTYQGNRRHWEDYPINRRWNIMLEVACYMNHLFKQGILTREEKDGVFYFYA